MYIMSWCQFLSVAKVVSTAASQRRANLLPGIEHAGALQLLPLHRPRPCRQVDPDVGFHLEADRHSLERLPLPVLGSKKQSLTTTIHFQLSMVGRFGVHDLRYVSTQEILRR